MGYLSIFVGHWKDGVFWLSWNLLCMIGLWAVGALVFLFFENPPWFELFDRGQFFLYSVGLLGQAMYILTKEREITTIPQRPTFIILSVLSLLVCAVFFIATVLSNFTNSPDIVPRTTILRFIGIATFSVSMLIGFFVTIADEKRTDVDFSALSQKDLRRLEDMIP